MTRTHIARRFGLTLQVVAAMWSVVAVARADEAAAALYVRNDSDQTLVISPRVRANKRLGEGTNVDVTYAADIWTSASIDIRTSASVSPVTEQRDEIDLGLRHEWDDIHLRSAYRYSTEHDYSSHGLIVGSAIDLAQNATTLDLNLAVIGDTVGQSGNPEFARALTTVDAALSYTQVLDPVMFMTLTYELAHIRGYQSSPYRYVGVGGTGYGCVAATLCLPEHVPSARTRHALAFLIRRALSDTFSLGVNYRYYFDDWSLSSHTALVDLAAALTESTVFSLRYRFYTQGAVEFYQAVYSEIAADQYRTRDRELSKLTYHRAGAEIEHVFDVGGNKLGASIALSGNFYEYADFKGLDKISAVELSAGLSFEN